MSDYNYTTDKFLSKDNLAAGSALKVLQGYEFEDEFLDIQSAILSKLDNTGDSWTGTLDGPTLEVTTQLTLTGVIVGLTGGTF